MYRVLLLALLAFQLGACIPLESFWNFFFAAEPSPSQVLPTPTPQPMPTLVPSSPTPQPIPTLVPYFPPSPTRIYVPPTPLPTWTPIPCTVRTDWGTYTVLRGDTLARIAARGNTSIAILTAGNCLSDPNLIYAGQVLRVPGPVIPATPVITSTPVPDVRGWVNVAPLVNGQPSGTDTLSAGEAVTLKWTKAPGNAASVNFLLITNGTTLVLGSDNDLSDGASAPWTVPQGLDGDLVAYAYNASQSLIRQSQPRHVVS